MSPSHDPEVDVFLSFAPEDNEPVEEGEDPCVAFVCGALQQFAARRNRTLRIRSTRDLGGDVESVEVAPSPSGAALFIAVLSKHFVESLDGPMEAGEFEAWAGGPEASKQRMFALLRTPIEDRSMIFPALQDVRTFDLFGADGVPTRGHLTSASVSLAMQIVAALDQMAAGSATSDSGPAAIAEGEASPPSALAPAPAIHEPEARRGGSIGKVFLAHVEDRLREGRRDLQRELERRGFEVVPAGEAKPTAAEIETEATRGLTRALLSIHLLGDAYDEPAHIECSLAGRCDDVERMVWIEPAGTPDETRVADLVDAVEAAADRTTVFRAASTPLKSFETEVVRTLRERTSPGETAPETSGTSGADSTPFVYLCYESSDVEWRRQLGDLLAQARLRPRWPDHESESARDRQARHIKNLLTSKGVVVVLGDAPIAWLQTLYDDLEEAGRSDMPLAVCMVDPIDKAKTEWDDPLNPPILAGSRVTREQLDGFIERVRSYRQGAA